MSEQESTTPAPEATPTDDAAAQAPQADAATPEDADSDGPAAFDAEKALAKIRKANSEARALRERTKTAEDKAADLAATAAKVPDLEAELVRERVARKLSLPDELVDRLRGATEAEVMADAEKLVALVAPRPKASSRPVESLQPGSGSTPEPSLDDRIAAARQAGDFRTVISLENQKLQSA